MKEPDAKTRQPWYVEAFGAWYGTLYAHRDEATAAAEVDVAVKWLGIEPTSRCLDLCCGMGRHLRPLQRHSECAVGVDLSPQLIEEASNRGSRNLVRADQRRLPFSAATFDHVLSFFTSFGYFETDAENAAALLEMARVLRGAGRLLMDLPNATVLERSLVPRSHDVRDGFTVTAARTWDGFRVRKSVVVTNGEGVVVHQHEENVRVFNETEITEMMSRADLRILRRSGGFDGRPVERGDRLILVAEKAC